MKRNLLGIILFVLAFILGFNLVETYDICKVAICCN